MTFKLREHDYIVTAYAEYAHGPGWANWPVWVVIKSRLDSTYRIECIQPEDQSAEILNIWQIANVVNKQFTEAVRHHMEPTRGKVLETKTKKKVRAR